EPAGDEVDAHMVDLCRLRTPAVRAEEEDVGGLELRECDPLCRLDLAAHGVGRAALQRRPECVRAGVGLELVDAPDEARAVETARHQLPRPEGILWALARSAPDVR